ncbi:MAG: hypothetical protein HY939_04620 [Gammaproteobacteria bacterium]|nr:hypothetical protein [Gammaproteobacteria bacterium]
MSNPQNPHSPAADTSSPYNPPLTRAQQDLAFQAGVRAYEAALAAQKAKAFYDAGKTEAAAVSATHRQWSQRNPVATTSKAAVSSNHSPRSGR